jgi:hypothetical protein
MNLECSVFGVGPVSLIQDGFIPRNRSRVKMKLKLDAIYSPALDHVDEVLAPVEKFSLLTKKLATVQNRVLAPLISTLSLVDDRNDLSDKSQRSLVSLSVPSPPRKPRVLVWIRRDLFIARRFVAADCFPAREFERVPYAKPFSFARDWWSWRGGGGRRCGQRSSRWHQVGEVVFGGLVVGAVEVGSRALMVGCSRSRSLPRPRSSPMDLALPLVSKLSHKVSRRCLVILVVFSRCRVIPSSKVLVHGKMHSLCNSCLR